MGEAKVGFVAKNSAKTMEKEEIVQYAVKFEEMIVKIMPNFWDLKK